MSAAASTRTPEPAHNLCFMGVEVGPMVIRAEIYSDAFDVLAKMKLSTKPERGLTSTIERIERCIRYACDECDLPLSRIEVIGVGLPGVVDANGRVTLDRGFDLKDFPLRQQLETRLGRPFCVGNIFELACHAIQAFEGSHDSGDFAVLFPGAILAAGLVVNGKPVDLSMFPPENPLLPSHAGNVVKWTEDSRFRGFRARDFRKAIRKGNEEARLFLRNSVVEAADFGVRLVRAVGVRQLVLGGGATDENKADMLDVAKTSVTSFLGKLGSGEPDAIQITTSELGDSAGMTGAALVAAQSHRSRSQPIHHFVDRRPALAR